MLYAKAMGQIKTVVYAHINGDRST